MISTAECDILRLVAAYIMAIPAVGNLVNEFSLVDFERHSIEAQRFTIAPFFPRVLLLEVVVVVVVWYMER